eukprot:TRINITY_DN1584_c0_g2_i2.p1 TRINITY_DN1584_c0_g2~~TRINITY_DN1584_c0_g2_i2.p1  ORF type:complete len:180 (-),score=23.96 TRINITY_DN1584_c0_g2_i2:16-555(-)
MMVADIFRLGKRIRILNNLISRGVITRPRRSVRSIGWFNEENGADGAYSYYNNHNKQKNQNHIFVGESDNGNFFPNDFGYSGGSEASFKEFSSVVSLLSVFNITATYGTGTTTDNKMWVSETACVNLHSKGHTDSDPYYFWFHHTDADTPDKLNADGLKASVAAIAVVLYVSADMVASY